MRHGLVIYEGNTLVILTEEFMGNTQYVLMKKETRVKYRAPCIVKPSKFTSDIFS